MTQNANYRELPLLRTAKVCRILSALCKTAFIILLLWSTLAFSVMCYAVFSSSPPIESILQSLVIPVAYALYSANSCLIPLILSRILGDISIDGKAFTLKNSKRLMFLAILQIVYALLEALLASSNQQFLSYVGNTSVEVGRFAGDFLANAGTSLNLYPLLMFAAFFALSYVFKYGVLLQQESDETL